MTSATKCAARRGREPEPQAAPGAHPGPRRRGQLRRQPDGRRHLSGEAAVPVHPGARSRRRDCRDPGCPEAAEANALRALYTASSKGLVRGVSGLLGGLIRNSGKALAVYRRERLGLLELMQRVKLENGRQKL